METKKPLRIYVVSTAEGPIIAFCSKSEAEQYAKEQQENCSSPLIHFYVDTILLTGGE